jgi:acetyl-CoA carboxylase carboxyl transferase subunit alpha
VELAKELPKGKAVPVLVRRDNESLYLAVRLPEQGMILERTPMNPNNCLDFERPIAELEAMLKELRHLSAEQDLNIGDEIARLEAKSKALTDSIFASLTPWQISQIARHPLRPYTLDYVERLFTDFQELHGDRAFADDHAIVGGLARLDGQPVLVIGHQKGRDTKEKIYRNFGMPRPEGYRKALRLMKLAERFRLPVMTFIDTPGAYPGIGAEERGQSEAIARNLFEMSRLRVPVICVVIGEGGSGGALAVGVGDRVLMLQYGTYSVISPEGCAAILWKSADKAPEAAEAMGLTADRLLKLNLIDGIIPEPPGGAHRDVGAWPRTSAPPCGRNSCSSLDALDRWTSCWNDATSG